jgi:hypothetical protein
VPPNREEESQHQPCKMPRALANLRDEDIHKNPNRTYLRFAARQRLEGDERKWMRNIHDFSFISINPPQLRIVVGTGLSIHEVIYEVDDGLPLRERGLV